MRKGQEEERSLLSHRLSLRLFLRCGLDWALCGEETSFFRSLVGEGGPVPLPIWMGKKKQKHALGHPMAHRSVRSIPGSCPGHCALQASGGLCLVSGSPWHLNHQGSRFLAGLSTPRILNTVRELSLGCHRPEDIFKERPFHPGEVVVPARWGYGKYSGTSPTSLTVTLTILGQSDASLVTVTLIQKKKMKK